MRVMSELCVSFAVSIYSFDSFIYEKLLNYCFCFRNIIGCFCDNEIVTRIARVAVALR